MSANGDTQQLLEKDKEHFQTMRIPEVKSKQMNCLIINCNHYKKQVFVLYFFKSSHQKRLGSQVDECLCPAVHYISFLQSYALVSCLNVH